MRHFLGTVLLVVTVGCSAGDSPAPPLEARWDIWSTGTTATLRGLHVVDTSIAWACGSGGTFLRSLDGGLHWEDAIVEGAETLDFRDIHAWDRDRAVVLSAGAPAHIYRTVDGGLTWRLVYINETPGIFFNAMSFWDDSRGIAVGDPIDGRFMLIVTDDGGKSWKEIPSENRPEALEGEANFAASGTCLTVRGEDDAWFGTGGPAARVFRTGDAGASWTVASTPLPSGQPSQGVFSVHFLDARRGVVVGGDYLDESNGDATAAVTSDGGATWKLAKPPPSGFRECVVPMSDAFPEVLLAVGPMGTDVSEDGGLSWRPISDGRFHAAEFSGDGSVGVAVGVDGLAGCWSPVGDDD